MKLLHASDYEVRTIRESTSDVVPLCEVMVGGQPTGKILQGAVFKAALKWREYILLFITDDVPFEEGLNIYLLDQQLNVADYARMYFGYSTGIFSDLDLTEDDIVRFRFLGEKIWTLRLFVRKQFVPPIISASLGVHRPWTFSRKFQLSSYPSSVQTERDSITYPT